VAVTLVSVSKRFVKRTNESLALYRSALILPAPACERTHAAGKERLVLALHDTWCQFAREYFTISAFRSPTASSGSRLAKAPGCPTYAATVRQMRVVNGRPPRGTWTPKWHFPNALVDLAVRLGLTNESLISGVLSLPQANVLADLTTVRNYVAHRNMTARRSYIAFASRAALSRSMPPSLLIDDATFYGAPMYEHWISVLQYLATTLA